MKTLVTIAAIMMMSIATANAQRHNHNTAGHAHNNKAVHHTNYVHGSPVYGKPDYVHHHNPRPTYVHAHHAPLIVRHHTHYLFNPAPIVGAITFRTGLPVGFISTRLLVNIPYISTSYDTRIGIHMPRYIQVVNEYAIGGRRNYINDADLTLQLCKVGYDRLGKAQYVVDLVDLHAYDNQVIASWVVENRHSDVRWDIENVLDNNRDDIARIVKEWDYRHMQYVA